MSIAHKLAIASFLTLTTLASAQGHSTPTLGVGYAPEHPALDTFRVALAHCSSGVEAHRFDAATTSACTTAADVNNHIQSAPHFNDSLQANQLAAISLAGAGEVKRALTYADRAVSLADHMHITARRDQGDASALSAQEAYSAAESSHDLRARLRAEAGDLPGADKDAAEAEKAARNMKGVGLGPDRLRADLEYRANLLGQLSQPAQAKQKLAEAQKL